MTARLRVNRTNDAGEGEVALLVGVVVVVLLGVFTFIMWQVGWWFNTQNANRETTRVYSSLANQTTVRQLVTDGLKDVQDESVQISQLPAGDPSVRPIRIQRKLAIDKVCNAAAKVLGDPLPDDQAVFVATNCSFGSTNPSSKYFQIS